MTGAGLLAAAHQATGCALVFLITSLSVLGQSGWSSAGYRRGHGMAGLEEGHQPLAG